MAEHRLRCERAPRPFGPKRSRHLDYVGAYRLLALISEGERALPAAKPSVVTSTIVRTASVPAAALAVRECRRPGRSSAASAFYDRGGVVVDRTAQAFADVDLGP